MAHRTTLLLGAGASRAVSYAGKRSTRSPLDADFFELLQKVEMKDKYETSVVPGSFFEMPAHFRVGLGGDSETLTQGLERLGKALDELRLK